MIRFLFDFFYRKDDSVNNILVSFIIAFSMFTFVCGLCVIWEREYRKCKNKGKNKKRDVQYLVEYTKDGKFKNGFTFDAIDDNVDKNLLKTKDDLKREKKEKEEKDKEEKEEKEKEEEKYRNVIFYFVVMYYIYKIYQVI